MVIIRLYFFEITELHSPSFKIYPGYLGVFRIKPMKNVLKVKTIMAESSVKWQIMS